MSNSQQQFILNLLGLKGLCFSLIEA